MKTAYEELIAEIDALDAEIHEWQQEQQRAPSRKTEGPLREEPHGGGLRSSRPSWEALWREGAK